MSTGSQQANIRNLVVKEVGKIGVKIKFSTAEEFIEEIDRLSSFLIFYHFNKEYLEKEDKEKLKQASGFIGLLKRYFNQEFPNKNTVEGAVRKILENWWVLEAAKSLDIKIISGKTPAAVTYKSNGEPLLMLNPFFLSELDLGDLITVLRHEMYHLLSYHPIRGQKVYENAKIRIEDPNNPREVVVQDILDKEVFSKIANFVADTLVHENISEADIDRVSEEFSKRLGVPVRLYPPASKAFPGVPPEERLFEPLLLKRIMEILRDAASRSGKGKKSRGKGEEGESEPQTQGQGGEGQGPEGIGDFPTGGGGTGGKGKPGQQFSEFPGGGGVDSGEEEGETGTEKGGKQQGDQKGKKGKGTGKEETSTKGTEKGSGEGKDEGEKTEGDKRSLGKITEGNLPDEIKDKTEDFVLPDEKVNEGSAESNTRRIFKEALERAKNFLKTLSKPGLQMGEIEELLPFLVDPESFIIDVRQKKAEGSVYNPVAKLRKLSHLPAGTIITTLQGDARNLLTPIPKGKGRILLVIDTSGSITSEQLNKFFSIVHNTVSGAKGKSTEVYVLQIDAGLQRINGKYVNLMGMANIRAKEGIRVAGRGGTDFRALASDELYTDMKEKTRLRPLPGETKRFFQHVVILTDGIVSDFPATVPEWAPKEWVGIYTDKEPDNSPSWIKWFDYGELVRRRRLPLNV